MRTLNQTTLANMQEYIIAFQKKNGRSPSYRQVQKAMNMSSLSLVQRYILALEREGRIERTRLGSIDMLPKLKPSGMAITPIVGSIACGQPVDAVENIEESVALPRAIFGSGSLFILRAKGDSIYTLRNCSSVQEARERDERKPKSCGTNQSICPIITKSKRGLPKPKRCLQLCVIPATEINFKV